MIYWPTKYYNFQVERTEHFSDIQKNKIFVLITWMEQSVFSSSALITSVCSLETSDSIEFVQMQAPLMLPSKYKHMIKT